MKTDKEKAVAAEMPVIRNGVLIIEDKNSALKCTVDLARGVVTITDFAEIMLVGRVPKEDSKRIAKAYGYSDKPRQIRTDQ